MSETESSNYSQLIDRFQREAHVLTEAHNYMCNFWANCHFYVGLPTTVLSAIVSASVFSQSTSHNEIAGFISIIVTCLTAISTFFNPSERKDLHRVAKNSYHTFSIKVEVSNLNEFSNHQIESLINSFETVRNTSPQVAEWVYQIGEKRAQRKYKSIKRSI